MIGIWVYFLILFVIEEAVFRGLLLTGPDWLTGGGFGVEGSVVGIAVLIVFGLLVIRFATGRHGPWQIRAR